MHAGTTRMLGAASKDVKCEGQLSTSQAPGPQFSDLLSKVHAVHAAARSAGRSYLQLHASSSKAQAVDEILLYCFLLHSALSVKVLTPHRNMPR